MTRFLDAHNMVRWVAGSQYCEEIDRVANPEDPKDLFGLVGALSPVGT